MKKDEMYKIMSRSLTQGHREISTDTIVETPKKQHTCVGSRRTFNRHMPPMNKINPSISLGQLYVGKSGGTEEEVT